jgi:signal transduction histidine kinase/CheY-like chemotaxis protein
MSQPKISSTPQALSPEMQQEADPSSVSHEPAEYGELQNANPEFAALLDSVDRGVLLFNASGELCAVNDRLAEMLRIDPVLLRGSQNFETLVARVAPNFAGSETLAARWSRRFQSDEASWDELELLRPERKIIERFARPVLDGKGERTGWLEVYRDVTSQRLVEKKMVHTDRMAALGQLVSNVAHELNNPLTGILGYAQLLQRRKGTDGHDREVRYILEQAERASRIAKSLLLFAREARPGRTLVDLNEVVGRTLGLRSYDLGLVHITAEASLDPELPPVMADAAQMQQVLINLVFNAEQALEQKVARDGRGHVRIRTGRISERRVAIEISDNGPGIPPEVLPRIFDPFFTTKPPGVGTGLGLSIVYGIVQDHGGEVLVESREGHGATFTIKLPVAVTAALGATAPDGTQSPGTQPSLETQMGRDVGLPVDGKTPDPPRLLITQSSSLDGSRSAHQSPSLNTQRNRRILVVEDEPTVAQLIADVLGEDGHAVDVLLDSRKGLQRLEQLGYDLIICDLRMPHLDGSGLYRELLRRNSPLVRRLVFITGDSLSANTASFLEKSGIPCLTKPFFVEQLKTVVYAALAAARRHESERARRRFSGTHRSGGQKR